MSLPARRAVCVYEVAGGLALFSDATDSPPGLSEEALAERAGTAVAALLGRSLPVLYARQVHSRLIYSYGTETSLAPRPHLVGACDGLVTGESGIVLTVRTADCLPIVLAGGGVVGILHGGWRGLAADILGVAVARFAAEYGVAPRDMKAVIGVGVGSCHYRVGDEVTASLAVRDVGSVSWRHADHVDLSTWAGGRLLVLGLSPEHVTVIPGCTACSPVHHSHRRDGAAAGRQWAAVLLTDGQRTTDSS